MASSAEERRVHVGTGMAGLVSCVLIRCDKVAQGKAGEVCLGWELFGAFR